MRSPKYAAPAAMLMALTLTTSFTAHAAAKDDALLATRPNLVIEVTADATDQSLVIRNAGGVASGPCHVRLHFSTNEICTLPIMELQPGAVEKLWPALARNGKSYTIQIEADCFREVAESNEHDNDVSVRILQ